MACPEYEWSSSQMEKYVFGRQRKSDEKFGIFKQVATVQATDNTVLRVSQDGGFVTTLLLHALDRGFIDGAIVSGIADNTPFLPYPKLVFSREEILQSAGTRYFYSANVLALPATFGKAKALAFVGTPCQIRAIRKMQTSGLKKYVANIKLLIGLMCSECFTYDGLMKELQEKLGIRPEEIRKINIKGKMLIATEKETKLLSLAEAKRYSRKSCRFCEDFSSEFADISAGGLGLDRWTLAIIRTAVGKDLYSKVLEAGMLRARETPERVLDLLCKLSSRKAKGSCEEKVD
jgi:coenzyme F420 hydrogenase subunit beta